MDSMSILRDLIEKIDDATLRERILHEADRLFKQKKFGLVFEEHLPECTPLYDIPIEIGRKVALKTGYVRDIYTVLNVEGDGVVCERREDHEKVTLKKNELVAIAEFGEAIYPTLDLLDMVENAPHSQLWHTLIQADNYHALQLLEYLYPEKVDCIYIDPPYNTGARDWKYNNDYVDSSDSYRHSKWLSMMEKRLKLAKKLLNPKSSALIVTIDEKEYLHLGCLLEELFPEAKIQMISTVINGKGVARGNEFYRVNEYIYFVRFGGCSISDLDLPDTWIGNVKTTTTDKIRWGSLIRSGSNSDRKHSPGCFYPIFISKDKKHFCGVGKPIPAGQSWKNIQIPEGQIPIFPIHEDGREGCWQYSPEAFLEIQQKGYARISTQTKSEATIRYIAKGWQNKVESGEIKVIGKAEDGSLIFDDSDYVKKFIPANQWWIPEHDATEFGSKLLQNIIGKRFSYPKSLYAVRDTLRFVVADKPNALIVDFFAGSGTTLHAVNLLNSEDNGKRRCVLVTNNEVSVEESKILLNQGLKPGDQEWEKLGIAQHVTWPRTVCSITGKDINGNALKGTYGCDSERYVEFEGDVIDPDSGRKVRGKVYKKERVHSYPRLSSIKLADGFQTNAVFFKLKFLDKTFVSLGRQFRELLPVLWMKAGAVGKCPKLGNKELPHYLVLPQNRFAVLVDEIFFVEFCEELNKHPEINTLFIVSDSDSAYHEMIQGYENKNCYQLYRDYLDNFRINTGR